MLEHILKIYNIALHIIMYSINNNNITNTR